ncbi:MAG: rhomboid family intramembrane serine protease [Verrucomicrobia bacterium]|jgi:GlpG protein|nr:rhomboid family intramembrane serine protease [Verrucomicrobiota bacterium]
MRLIGYIEGTNHARTFGDFLYAQGVDNQVDRTQGDRWEIWIAAEDQVETGKSHLISFQSNPADPKFVEATEKAQEKRLKAALEQEAYTKKVKDRDEITRSGSGISTGKLTLLLMVVCGVVFLFQELGYKKAIFQQLSISNSHPGGGSIGLAEVQRGQIWRIITPIFMHGDILHIFFNLMWLRMLGTIIEYRQGWKWLLVIVLATASISNLAQYYMSGPLFLGISGVVFGLLGYVWIKGKFDPFSGMFLPPGVVFMMLLWLGLGVSGVLEKGLGVGIANTAHIGGLVVGCLMGYLSSLRKR